MTATLDALTDPVVPVTPVVRGNSVTRNNHDNMVDQYNGVNSYNSVNSDDLDNPDFRVTGGVSGSEVNRVSGAKHDTTLRSAVADNAGVRDNSVTRVTRKPGPPRTAEPRQHLKVRATLAEELRDAVSYMIDHGQPRTKLNEVIDQAVEHWLAQAKKELLSGKDFPARQRR